MNTFALSTAKRISSLVLVAGPLTDAEQKVWEWQCSCGVRNDFNYSRHSSQIFAHSCLRSFNDLRFSLTESLSEHFYISPAGYWFALASLSTVSKLIVSQSQEASKGSSWILSELYKWRVVSMRIIMQTTSHSHQAKGRAFKCQILLNWQVVGFTSGSEERAQGQGRDELLIRGWLQSFKTNHERVIGDNRVRLAFSRLTLSFFVFLFSFVRPKAFLPPMGEHSATLEKHNFRS